MKRFWTFLLLSSFCTQMLYGIDDYFRFPEANFPGKVRFEKERRLCLFPFRAPTKQPDLIYLSTGIPAVLFSELRAFRTVYDKDVLPMVIQYPFGQNSPDRDFKKRNGYYSWDVWNQLESEDSALLATEDPRYIQLTSEIFLNEAAPFPNDLFAYSELHSCHYSVSGEYSSPEPDKLKITVELFDYKVGKIITYDYETSIRKGYQELTPLAEKLKVKLAGRTMVPLTVKTGELENVLVYVDGFYLGKTPFQDKMVITGKHEIRLFKEGYQEEKRFASVEKQTSLNFQLVPIEKEGIISVNSSPAGAEAFLGNRLLGKTPFENLEVPVGPNRLRVSKKGYVDYFHGVDIEPNKPIDVFANLKEGNSEIYYKSKPFLFLDYTYNDFVIYSLYGILLFYSGYYYYNLKADQELSHGWTRLSYYNNYASITNLTNNDPLLYYYGLNTVNTQTRNRVDYYRSWSGNFGGKGMKTYGGVMLDGMVSMFLLAGVFYWLGLDAETLDIGFSPAPTNRNLPYAQASGHFGYKFHF